MSTTPPPLMTPADVDKLIGCLGMLSSEFDGERAAAGLVATGLLKKHGLQWRDIVRPPAARETPKTAADYHPVGWRGKAMQCLNHRPQMVLREISFLQNIVVGRATLTTKQQKWLDSIAARVL